MSERSVAVHSDYLTLPYTPSEAAELTRLSTEQGIMTLHMPQFNRMRDIAINERYGFGGLSNVISIEKSDEGRLH